MGLAQQIEKRIGKAMAPIRAGSDKLASRKLGVSEKMRTLEVKSSAFPVKPKETTRMISSGFTGPKYLADDGNELRRVVRELTCAVTASIAPGAGKPGYV